MASPSSFSLGNRRQLREPTTCPTVAAQCAAGHAIADAVSEDELDAEHIVPDVFDEDPGYPR